MGYTHYWRASRVDSAAYALALSDIAVMLDQVPADLIEVEALPPDGVQFNGIAALNLDHETFYLPAHAGALKSFQFCKTAQKPYDLAVTACLARLAEIPGIEVSSDGDREEWEAGVALASKLLGRVIANPIGDRS